jgi:Na+/phosphate symporter
MQQSFSAEVRAFLFEAIKNNLNKEDIMRSIQMLIRKYEGVKDITFRNSVEHLIIEESAASIHLSENDLDELWK